MAHVDISSPEFEVVPKRDGGANMANVIFLGTNFYLQGGPRKSQPVVCGCSSGEKASLKEPASHCATGTVTNEIRQSEGEREETEELVEIGGGAERGRTAASHFCIAPGDSASGDDPERQITTPEE
jgi:hypothetical protein